MNNTLCQTAKLRFIDENSAQIFKEKEHVLVGISPANSYYSKEKIEQILTWVLEQNFKDFHFFLADEIYYFNFLALGYSEKEALKKTRIKDNQLKNKVLHILTKFNIPENKILYFSELKRSLVYQKYFKIYKNNLENDPFFLNITYQIFNSLSILNQQNVNENFALEYLFSEIPILLNTPDLLFVHSSICIYHQNNALYEFLYVNRKMQIKSQGFGFLDV